MDIRDPAVAIPISEDVLSSVEWYDSSKIKEHQLCPRRYAYRYEEHLHLKGSKTAELDFGRAWHAALECFYTDDWLAPAPCPHEYDGQSHEECCWCRHKPDADVPLIYAVFLSHFRKEQEDDRYRTQLIGLSMLNIYSRIYGKGEAFTIEAVEQTFILPFHRLIHTITHLPNGDKKEETINAEVDFAYIGKMDLVIRDPSGELMPSDHKSTTRFGEAFEGSFRLDIQMTGYIAGLRALTGEPVWKAVINAARVSKNIDTDSFMRKQTTRTDEDISRWYSDVRSEVARIRASRKSGHWSLHDYACYAYNRVCPYRALCTSPSRVHPEMKEDLYDRVEWRPI